MAEYLVVLSRSKSATFWVKSVRDTILKCTETGKGTNSCKGINTWPVPVDSSVSAFFPARNPISLFLTFQAFHSRPSWPLNTKKKGSKSANIPAAWWQYF